MTTIGEHLSDAQRAELEQRVAQTMQPKLDLEQLSQSELQTREATLVTPELPLAGQAAEIAVTTVAKRLPWQKSERRVATSTQGAPKEAVSAEHSVSATGAFSHPKSATVTKTTKTATEKAQERWGGTVKLGQKGSLYEQLGANPQIADDEPAAPAEQSAPQQHEVVNRREAYAPRRKSRLNPDEDKQMVTSNKRPQGRKAQVQSSQGDPQSRWNGSVDLGQGGSLYDQLGTQPATPFKAGTMRSPEDIRALLTGMNLDPDRHYVFTPVNLIPMRPADVSVRVQNRLQDAWEGIKRLTGFDREQGGHEKTRRRLFAGAVIGAVAVGAAVLEARGFSVRGHGGVSQQLQEQLHKKQNPNQGVIDALTPTGAPGQNSNTLNDLANNNSGGSGSTQTWHTVKLQHGQTVWGLEAKAHPHASQSRIRQLTQLALRHRHLSWEQARYLADGEEVDII